MGSWSAPATVRPNPVERREMVAVRSDPALVADIRAFAQMRSRVTFSNSRHE